MKKKKLPHAKKKLHTPYKYDIHTSCYVVKRFNHRRRPLSAILIKGEDMYAVLNAKQFKEAIKQIKALGGYAVQVKKDGEVLHMSSYQMPNNCYDGKGEPQYYPCGDLLLVDVKFNATSKWRL